MSYADPPLLVAGFPRPVYLLAKRELFANPLMAHLMRGFQAYPVDRSTMTLGAVRQALDLLARDRAVVVFPEGRRSKNHSLQEGLNGAAYLAIKSGAPIIPVGITGTERVPSWRLPLPLTRMKMKIGPLFILPTLEGTPSRAVLESVRDMIMDRIAALLPEEYRGKYQVAVHSKEGQPLA